jgi:hypothetical protein
MIQKITSTNNKLNAKMVLADAREYKYNRTEITIIVPINPANNKDPSTTFI